MTGNANVYIEDGNGKVLEKSQNAGTADELGSVNLADKTTYYVRVAPFESESTNYRLVLNPGQVIPPNNQSSNPFTQQEYFQQLYGNTGSSSRGFSEHQAIDSRDSKAPYDVRALVGGQVVYVKSNGVQLQNVTANADSGYNPSTRKWVKASDFNNTVKIWNPDLQRYFTYLHFSQVNVKQGDYVNPGQMIGIEGSTGWSTGPHTHLAVTNQNNVKEDPLATLGKARGSGVLNKTYT
jgi:murein DD-endopeptidase MepM/ murein hydrolase activator NlpD